VIAFGIALALLLLLALWVRHRRRKLDPPGPLAGYDTGVRSPFRTPHGKFFGPRRGF